MSGKKSKRKTLSPFSKNQKKQKKKNEGNESSDEDYTPMEEDEKEEEDRQEEMEVVTCYVFRGLSTFLNKMRKELENKKQTKKQVEIVLLNINGVRYLPVREGWESFVQDSVSASCYIYSESPQDNVDRQLGDTLFHLHHKAPTFFVKMSMIDPCDNGYQLLQMFLMFLKEDEVVVTDKTCKARQKTLTDAMRDTYKLRKLMRKWIVNESNYLKGCSIMTELERMPKTSDDDWASFQPTLKIALAESLDPRYKGAESLLKQCYAVPKSAVQPELDVKHIAVFAKATRTRIVLLIYYRSDNWHLAENNDSFCCFDIDWRYSDTVPGYKYSKCIPDFGENFDFYRTAVMMRAPASLRVDGDYIYWNDKEAVDYIYSMWLPESYDPTRKASSGSAAPLTQNVFESLIPAAAAPLIPAAAAPLTQNALIPAAGNTGDVTAGNTGDVAEDDPHVQVGNLEEEEQTVDDAYNGAKEEKNELSTHEYIDHNDNNDDIKKGKRNAWSQDGPNNEYEGSTLWMLIDWLKSDRNYERWKRREDEVKGAMQKKVAAKINTADPRRNRRGKALGEKIVNIENRMQKAVIAVDKQLKKAKGLRGEKLMARIRREYHYFEELYPVMKDLLELRDIFAEMRGENMPPAASTNSVQDIEITRHESVAEAVQLANTSNASNLHTINAMEKLEIEGKTIDIQAKRKQQAIEIHAMQQEQRLKDYQAYCGLLKDKTDHDFIAQCFPTLVFFFQKRRLRGSEIP